MLFHEFSEVKIQILVLTVNSSLPLAGTWNGEGSIWTEEEAVLAKNIDRSLVMIK
jgi:hypothetical protein